MIGKHDASNVSNGGWAFAATVWTWLWTNTDSINHVVSALAGIGGLIVLAITIKRGLAGIRKDREEEAERADRRERERRADHDRIIRLVPKQEPPGELEEWTQ